MTVQRMKHKLMFDSKYKGPNWQMKVLLMSPEQTKAVYEKFKNDGLFKSKTKIDKTEKYHQMTIFEYMEAKK